MIKAIKKLIHRFRKKSGNIKKITIVDHKFDGADPFWDEVMDKNLVMFLLDDEAKNGISFQIELLYHESLKRHPKC